MLSHKGIWQNVFVSQLKLYSVSKYEDVNRRRALLSIKEVESKPYYFDLRTHQKVGNDKF